MKSKELSEPHFQSGARNHFFLIAGILLLSVTLTYFLYIPKTRVEIHSDIKAGDIAEDDIIIHEDITLEDSKATELERQKVQDEILPVYEFHQDQIDRSIGLISEWYETIVNFRKDKDSPESSRIDTLQQNLLERFTISLTQKQVRQLLRSSSFPNLEINDLLRVYRELAKSGILASKISSNTDSQNRIQIQQADKKNLSVLLEEVHDLKEAKDTIFRYLKEKSFRSPETELLANQIMEFIGSNLTYSESLTQIEKQKAIAQVNPVMIKLKAGKILVRKGDEFQEEDLRLFSLIHINQAKVRNTAPPYLVVFFAVFLLLFFMKILFNRWSSPSKNHHKAFNVFALLLSISIIVYRLVIFLTPLVLENIPMTVTYSSHTLYFALPFTFGALVVAFIFSFPHAVFFSFFNAMLGGILSNWDLHLSLYILAGNLTAALGVEFFLRLKRSTLFKSALLWVMPTQILFASLIFIDNQNITFTFFYTNTAMAISSVLISSILASFFIPLIETGFKLITELKLIELTNLNLPIFRQMLEKAPGTYHHSQMVASLAESAALDLNLSPLLLTAMALYHDIGKIDSPQFFTENYSVYTSPHDNLTPLESARSIINHVNRGLEMAAKLKLPAEISAAISQHHGSKIVKFFYDKALSLRTNGNKLVVDPSDFQYPGRKPQTIENAVIMIADQVEAASKSLSKPSDAEIKKVIEKVIESNIEDSQFNECQGLTFKTLSIISASFYKKLSSIYHMRIAYPGFDFTDKEAAENAEA